MRRLLASTLRCLAPLVIAVIILGADTESRWLVLNHAARQASEAKDYVKLRETLLELKPLLPGNPRIVHSLAASNALLGDALAALAGLRNLAGMGLVYDFAADADFTSLRKSREFAEIVQRVDDNKKPVSNSTSSFKLAGRDLI